MSNRFQGTRPWPLTVVPFGARSAERSAGPLGDGGGLDELGQRLLERGPAEVQADDRPLGIEQERGRDRVDAEGFDEVAPAAGVMDLPPGDVARLDEVE